jgi:cell division protein FtsL
MRSPFVALWTLAVVAATSAFVLYLSLRVRSVELGYELGRAHARVARLREVKRVLELELASHETPERVDMVARTLLGMAPPTPDRLLSMGPEPSVGNEPDPAAEAPGELARANAETTQPARAATEGAADVPAGVEVSDEESP